MSEIKFHSLTHSLTHSLSHSLNWLNWLTDIREYFKLSFITVVVVFIIFDVFSLLYSEITLFNVFYFCYSKKNVSFNHCRILFLRNKVLLTYYLQKNKNCSYFHSIRLKKTWKQYMVIHIILIDLKKLLSHRCVNLQLILPILIYPHLYDIKTLIFIYSKYSCFFLLNMWNFEATYWYAQCNFIKQNYF